MVEVVVTRESEWDDSERNWMLALGLYESGVGPCGFHHSLTTKPGARFKIEHEDPRCPACRDRDRYNRVLAERDAEFEKQLGDEPPAMTIRPSDGRSVTMQMVPDAAEVAESGRRATGQR